MSTSKAYDQWSATYDTVVNPTRDLEKTACEKILGAISFTHVVELGGGTGKNTGWLASRAERVVSVDFSTEMQAIARSKVLSRNVEFRIADVREPWSLGDIKPDLIVCSLILEHVEDLDPVFAQAATTLIDGGRLYICELHPFKQYEGSKARFETEDGIQMTDCFRHHTTDYTSAAFSNGFSVESMDEWFDGDGRDGTPRLISFVFRT